MDISHPEAALILLLQFLLQTTRYMACDALVIVIDRVTVGARSPPVASGMKVMFGKRVAWLIHGPRPKHFATPRVVACRPSMKSSQIAFKAQGAVMMVN